MVDRVRLTPGAEMPDQGFTWRDSAGAIIPFETVPHTFELRIATVPRFVKGALGGSQDGITAYDVAPNVVIQFAAGELDVLPPGFYSGSLWARRSADGRDRAPLRFDVEVDYARNWATDSATVSAAATVTVVDALT